MEPIVFDRGGGRRGHRRGRWIRRPRRRCQPDHQGRPGQGRPDRRRGADPAEGHDPRGEGREAPPAARGRGGGRAKRRTELQNLERRLLARDEQLDQRADMLEEKSRKINDRERELEHEREDARQAQPGAGRRPRAACPGMSAEDAKGVLLEAIREEAEHDAVKLARSIERRARDEAQEKAREIIVTAMQRVAADHTAEHTVTVVHLPSDEMKGRIIGREGRNIRALEQATGVDLIIDDTPETVVLSGFDPVRREVARIAVTKLIADGRIHPGRIEEVVDKARAEVDLDHPPGRRAGRLRGRRARACRPSSSSCSGRLKYRTSYGQNVLVHIVETSHLAAVMAAELGADIQAAKIGGLLHDIGKAVDHEVEGPHAAIGAAIAQKHNMPMKVVNGIAAHHQEVEYACIEAPIVQVADAISASRPGARGETMETYVKRLEDLQGIAESFAGVERSFAVQAGREVRILVRPEEIDDLTATPARPRHRQEDRGQPDLPGPDQGHGHPRDARRRVREVATVAADARRGRCAAMPARAAVGPIGRTRLGNPPNGNAPRPPGACRVLMIGDLIGKPGRVAVEALLPRHPRGARHRLRHRQRRERRRRHGPDAVDRRRAARRRRGRHHVRQPHLGQARDLPVPRGRTTASCGRSTTARTRSRAAAGARTRRSTAPTSRSSTSRAGRTCSRSRTRSPMPTGCSTRRPSRCRRSASSTSTAS